MGKPTGFLEYQRRCGQTDLPADRIKHFKEFHGLLSEEEQRLQGARCMDCGVPFCQAGVMVGGMVSGCPLHNLVPEINDLVFHGNWEQAYIRLSKTHCLPEFTSRVCPALCESACTCGLHADPVATRENERAVIEYAFAHGLVRENPPQVRTGKSVAVVGSGPAGLAAAIQLNRRGHSVTVYERSDRPGGLLRYGIPNMKLDKGVIDRRIRLMEESGIRFVCNANVGRDIKGRDLLKKHHRVLLACGAKTPRDIAVPGREAKGIWFAVEFLTAVTRQLLDSNFADAPTQLVRDKHVLVIGGGDTGNDCVGTAVRLGAASVTQLEMMPKPPEKRAENNPWPEWPKVLKTDYGQEEAIYAYGRDPRLYQTTVTGFRKDEEGKVCAAGLVALTPQRDQSTGRVTMAPVAGSEKEIPADLVLIAAGFLGSEPYVAETFGLKLDGRMNVATPPGSYAAGCERVFAAGDMRRGQSLVVWAIAEGRESAREVDESLMGYSNLM
ncbi:MAG: glutamate synthase subunit beta [Enterocloster asparagiformis]|nr:glutamate synthase subunit beta [Enterocloster asparagiformis]